MVHGSLPSAQTITITLLQAEARLVLGHLDDSLADIGAARELRSGALADKARPSSAASSSHQTQSASQLTAAGAVEERGGAESLPWNEATLGDARMCRLRGVVRLARGETSAALADLCRAAIALDATVRRNATRHEGVGGSSCADPGRLGAHGDALPPELAAALGQVRAAVPQAQP